MYLTRCLFINNKRDLEVDNIASIEYSDTLCFCNNVFEWRKNLQLLKIKFVHEKAFYYFRIVHILRRINYYHIINRLS